MKKENVVSRIELEDLRKVFSNEATSFTPWLESHIDALAERLGMDLSVEQREKDVGDFSVDLLCEDSDGRKVIIENQLERSDHDHLGKLLTYLVNLDAATAIWITPDPRPEHMKVIDWLNESTAADIAFYLVKVEAIRIGESPIAPLFTVFAKPDVQTKEIGDKKKEWAERHYQRMEFWKGLLEKSNQKTKIFSNISPGRYHWIGAGAGKSGLSFNFVIWKDMGASELYIDYDRDTGEINKQIFDALYAQKDEIEKETGKLEWDRLDAKRASRIRKIFKDGGLTEPDKWPELQDKMIGTMIALHKTIKPRLAKIEV